MLNILLNAIIDAGLSAKVDVVTKNGIEMEAVLVWKKNNDRVKGVYYMRDFAEHIKKESIGEIVAKIINSLDGIDVNENMFKLENIKDKLRVCVANKAPNPDAVTRKFLDLVAYVRCEIEVNGNPGSTVINKKILQGLGISEEWLFALATSNTKRDARICGIYDAMFGKEGKPINEWKYIDYPMSMDILKTKDGEYGAGVIVCTDVLGKIAEKMNSDVIILPSSIHELILRKGDDIPMGKLSEMIQDVNAECVSDEEVLSTHPYLYVRSLGRVISID